MKVFYTFVTRSLFSHGAAISMGKTKEEAISNYQAKYSFMPEDYFLIKDRVIEGDLSTIKETTEFSLRPEDWIELEEGDCVQQSSSE